MIATFENVEIYMWDLHHELVIFLQSRNYFLYVPDNEIERGNIGLYHAVSACTEVFSIDDNMYV